MNHDDWLLNKLKDAEFAAEYLTAARADEDPATYPAALKKVGVLGQKVPTREGQYDENGPYKD